VYLLLHSHETPGGGFAGGIIIACAFILFTLAEGQRIGMTLLSKNVAAKLASAGALLFLGTVIAGTCRHAAFLRITWHRSAGIGLFWRPMPYPSMTLPWRSW